MAEFLRQQSLINQEKLSQLRICIIGTGAIGSFVALSLTKMGCSHLTLWDKDLVETHNVSNQFFTKESFGEPKVVAVAKECMRYSPAGIDVSVFNQFYDGQPLENFDVVIALTDNIEGRKACFAAAQHATKCQLYIDGRMGAEIFRSFAFSPSNAEQCKDYYDNYIDGVQNEELPCTARTIIYNVQLAASMISSFIKKFVQSEAMPFELIFDFKDYSLSKSRIEVKQVA